MDKAEFIDTYSDDLLFLIEARTALLTHPLRPTVQDLADASFCRVLAVVMIGEIEMMLEAWRERDKAGILDSYFAAEGDNGARVDSLFTAFTRAGITVSRDVFEDYLAVKYLRNTVVHARWKDHERDWLERRGFPPDTRQLTAQHWHRMREINDNMISYIAFTTLGRPPHPTRTLRLPAPGQPDETGILGLDDIPRVIWNNLERIDTHILDQIYVAAVDPRYCWHEGLTLDEVKALPDRERKRRFYLAAYRAGRGGIPVLAQKRGLATEALAFWREYRRLTVDNRGITDGDTKKAATILTHLHHSRAYPKGPLAPVLDAVGQDKAAELIAALVHGYQPFAQDEVVAALVTGKLVNQYLPNITPVTLLLLRLPIVDSDRTQAYIEEGRNALKLFKLGQDWYSYVEHSAPSPLDAAFYEDMCTLFLTHASDQGGGLLR